MMQPNKLAALAAQIRERVLAWPVDRGSDWFDKAEPRSFSPHDPDLIPPVAQRHG